MEMSKIFQTLLFAVVLLASTDSRPHRRKRDTCREPSPSVLRAIQRRYSSNEYRPRIHESFAMLDSFRTLRNISSEFVDKKYLRIEGDSFCPLASPETSLCPSFFVMEYDRFRLPDTMVQAECRCRDCTGQGGAGVVHECKKINYYTRVIRVVGCDENNEYEYDEVWEPISVGCHCVRSSSILVNRDNVMSGGPVSHE